MKLKIVRNATVITDDLGDVVAWTEGGEYYETDDMPSRFYRAPETQAAIEQAIADGCDEVEVP